MGAENILPDNGIVFVSHAHRGAPIYVNMGPGDHSVTRKQISPTYALEMAQMLIQYAQTELCHPPRKDE